MCWHTAALIGGILLEPLSLPPVAMSRNYFDWHGWCVVWTGQCLVSPLWGLGTTMKPTIITHITPHKHFNIASDGWHLPVGCSLWTRFFIECLLTAELEDVCRVGQDNVDITPLPGAAHLLQLPHVSPGQGIPTLVLTVSVILMSSRATLHHHYLSGSIWDNRVRTVRTGVNKKPGRIVPANMKMWTSLLL